MRMAWMKNLPLSLAGKSLVIVAACVLSMLSVGCEARGVGDPCVPEAIPQNGFTNTESYVETSSVQCRTRVCLVYRLTGHPDRIVGTPSCPSGPGSTTCVSQEDRDERVFCSCRCSSGGGDSTLPLCTCPEAFHCVDLLTQGGDAVRGGYCVPEDFCETNADCAVGQVCNMNGCVFPS